jgi:hypothetical protein
MSELRVYKRQFEVNDIFSHMKEMYGLVAKGFACLQDSTLGHLQSLECAIVGQPVDIEFITESYHSDEPTFCKVGQYAYLATECVDFLTVT